MKQLIHGDKAKMAQKDFTFSDHRHKFDHITHLN